MGDWNGSALPRGNLGAGGLGGDLRVIWERVTWETVTWESAAWEGGRGTQKQVTWRVT